MQRRVILVVVATGAFALGGCGSSATPSPAGAGSPVASQGAGASAAVPSASIAATQAAPSVANTATPAAPSVAIAASPAAACGSSTDAATVSATIKNFAFSPEPINAKVGDVVQWTNNDTTTHTVTLDDGSCDAGRIAPGKTAALVFTAPGTYTYHCAIHSTMKGTIKVSG